MHDSRILHSDPKAHDKGDSRKTTLVGSACFSGLLGRYDTLADAVPGLAGGRIAHRKHVLA